MISKNLIDQIVMNFSKCILEVQQGDDKRALFDSCLINNG